MFIGIRDSDNKIIFCSNFPESERQECSGCTYIEVESDKNMINGTYKNGTYTPE